MEDKIKEAVETAAKKKVEILTDFKNEGKSIKKEFVDFICGDLPKKECKEIKRDAKNAYATLIKFSGEEGKEKLDKMVARFAILAQYYNYLNINELKESLSHYGISLNFERTLVDDNPQIANSVPANLADILNDGMTTFGNIKNANDEIVGYCPEELSYSSENPSGMKKSDFSRLVTAKAMESMKNEEEYTEYMTKISEDSVFAIEREKNMQNMFGDMMNK